MKCLLCVCVVVLLTCAVADRIGKRCDRCVPAQECPAVIRMTRNEQQRWFKQYSCDRLVGEKDDVIVPFGFSPLAKGDYICCPNNNRDQQNPTRNSDASIIFDDSHVRGTNKQSESNKLKNNQASRRNEFGGLDSFNNQHGGRPLDSSKNIVSRNISTNQERPEIDSNYGHNDRQKNPNFSSDFIAEREDNNYNNRFGQQNKPIFSNNFQMPIARVENNYQSERRRSQSENDERDESLLNRSSQEYGSTRVSSLPKQGRSPANKNRRRNQRPNGRITNPTQNPYFISQNPGNTGQQNGNSFESSQTRNNRRSGNSFSDSENSSPFGVGHRGQCVLTSFPPEPSSGCCGRDPSDSDRIIESPNVNSPDRAPSQVSSWNPREEPRLGSFFRDHFGFSDRSKRAANTTSAATSTTRVTIGNRISGGKVTDIDQFPWLALLKTKFNYGNREASYNCGGSLISAKYVLTAAHCVKEEGGTVVDVEITLAEYDKRTFPNDCIDTSEGRQCIENMVMYAEDVVPHPEYDDERLHNDIALIRLRGKAPYTDFIRPICLPLIDIDNPDLTNIPLSVAGWGRNGIYNSDMKQSTVVNLVAQRECRRSYSQLTRRHLCAAGYTGEDTCKGDSGGPLMILYEGKYFIAGIVSGKRADSPCGTAVPSLYTNVYLYLDWIKGNMRN